MKINRGQSFALPAVKPVRVIDLNSGQAKLQEDIMAQSDTLATHPVGIEDIVTTVVMARVTEYFGFFVYAIASAIVFPRLFFPMYDPLTGTLISFAVFSLAFLARPFAGFASRRLERNIGPATKVTIGFMIFGSATVAIGLLPGYDQIGWVAPAALIFLRLVQGVGIGASGDGLLLQLQQTAPEGQKGLYDMLPQLGGPIGLVVAAAIYYVLTGFLTDEEFITFGWRFAFFAVMAVNIVSLFARIRLLSTDFGAAAKETRSQVVSAQELIANQWRPLLISIFLPLASYALFHVVTVFPLAQIALAGSHPISEILMMQLIGGGLAIPMVILSGIVADRYSKRFVVMISSIAVGLLALVIATLEVNPSAFIILGFLVLGFAFGQAGAVVPKRFLPRYRDLGTVLSTQVSWITGAAFAPLVALFLSAQFGLWSVGLYLLSGALASLLALNMLQSKQDSSAP